jgi:hypothetical protein
MNYVNLGYSCDTVVPDWRCDQRTAASGTSLWYFVSSRLYLIRLSSDHQLPTQQSSKIRHIGYQELCIIIWFIEPFMCIFPMVRIYTRSMRWRSWLRHCATCRKVAGSIPYKLLAIFHWLNPSGRTTALGSTQSPTEVTTRNISWG